MQDQSARGWVRGRQGAAATLAAALAAGMAGLTGCSVGGAEALGDTTSLYALVQTIDGVAFYPPLGPEVGAASAALDTSLLGGITVLLESTDAAGSTQTVASFGPGTSPALELKPTHQVYFVNVPAASYFRDASRAYRFRVLSGGVEIARSDLSDRVFAVLAANPGLMVGVKVRVEQRPAPVLAAVTPSSAVAGAESLPLTVEGSGFLRDSTVRFGDATLSTTLVSGSRLVATLPASQLATAGTSAVTVVTPAPGGGASTPATFTVQHARPVLTAVSPSLVTAGAGNVTVTLDGASFVRGAVASIGATALTTTFVSATQLTAVVSASFTASAGTLELDVRNPEPSAGASAALGLVVRPVTPSLSALTPASVVAGSGAFTLTVDGASFGAGAVVNLGGRDLVTTFVSGSRLTAAVAGADVASSGTRSITVINPGPSAQASAPLTFTVNNPTPILSSLAPASVAVGAAAFTLTVNGTSFLSGASVSFGGTALATTYVSSTRVTATVGAGQVSSYGSWAVTVTNPAPSAGASGSLTFSTTCATGTHVEGAACTSDTRSCTVSNGSGSQTWTGSAWGACTATSCNTGFVLSGGACVAGGTTSGSAGITCATLRDSGITGTGTYWVNPSGTSAFQAYCDMSTDGGGWTLVLRIAGGLLSSTGDVQSATLPARNTQAKFADTVIRSLARAGSREVMMNDGNTVYIFRYSDTQWSNYSSTGWTNELHDAKRSTGVWSNGACNGHWNNRGFSSWNDNPYAVCPVVWAGPTKYMTQYHVQYSNVGGTWEAYVR